MKNMKTKILITVFSLFLFASCSDVLDISPDGTQTLDEIFSDESTTGGYLSSCYQSFPGFSYRYVGLENLPTAISDDAWSIGRNGANSASLYLGAVTTVGNNNKLGYMKGMFGNNVSAWKYFYLRIRRINVFLSRIDTAAVPSETERAQWTAEARVLRAFYYTELINRYGSVYLLTEPTEVGFDETTLELSTYKEVADFIISECREAMKSDELPWRPELSTDFRRMNKSIAAALKSRVALFMASPLFADGQNYWEEAEAICKESLDELLAHDFELYTTVRNTSVFGDNAYQEYSTSTRDYSSSPVDKETILATNNVGTNWNYQGLPINNAVSAGMAPTQELVDAYPMTNGKYILDLAKPYNDAKHLSPNFASGSGYDETNPYVDRDPRFYATVYYNGSTALNQQNKQITIETFRTGNSSIMGSNTKRTQTGYYPRRHYHPLQRRGRNVAVSWRYMRLAEIYLNYAECAIENNHLTEALAAIKPIRDRVGMPNLDEVEGVTIDQDNLRLMYRNERRIEMAYEETRYYDVRRWTAPGDDMDVIRYATGMWIEKSVDGTLTHMRFQVGDSYDPETQTWTGEGLEKACYSSKYLLHPHDALEVSRILNSTGVDIQNPGW
ncbi:RagB/SusD family nutrient uptake outer membrane protein [Arenibacter aquaticus]|uniref:RagB/SusD family nutrient uptake outer membrane protein n=2 Tax=Arenibacter aquaticus TaxID=2489054 RepID=A0A430K4B2_9FLAO|nr:RagB/SusD family nutrient uptake outer membrane protein [Arenibacter aquaticus]